MDKHDKLRALADRIDHEQLWRRSALARQDMTPDQVARLDAGVALRRYADILQPGRWLIIPPTGSVQFSASTLGAAVGLAEGLDHNRIDVTQATLAAFQEQEAQRMRALHAFADQIERNGLEPLAALLRGILDQPAEPVTRIVPAAPPPPPTRYVRDDRNPACGHCGRLPGDPAHCDWIECAALARPSQAQAPSKPVYGWLERASRSGLPDVEHSARTMMAYYQGAEFPEQLAAQAAVPEGFALVSIERLQNAAAHAKLAADCIVCMAKEKPGNMCGWLDDACTSADIAANVLREVLAAAPQQKEGE